MNKLRQGWIGIAGLGSLVLFPLILFGAADVITWQHLFWHGRGTSAVPLADMTMASKSTLVLLLILFSAAGAGYAARITYVARRMVRSRRQMQEELAQRLSPMPRELIPVAMKNSGVRFMILSDPTPAAFTFGTRRPTIVVSSSMRDILATPALAAILAHEFHHVLYQDYTAEQLFHLLIQAGPFFGLRGLYAHYLTIREIRADQYATRVQNTSNHLIEAVVNTIHARRPAGTGEPAWNSVWEARIAALTEPQGVRLNPGFSAVWPLTILPLAGVLLLIVTSYSVSCH